MQFSSRPFLLSLLCFSALTAVLPQAAIAQEKSARLDVRASVQDGYVRVVMASPAGLPAYTVEKQGSNTVLVRFKQPVTLGGKDLAAANGALDVTALSAGILKVTFNDISRTRDVEVGNRLLLDLFGGTIPKTAPAKPAGNTADKPPENPPAKPEEKAGPAATTPAALPETAELPPGETPDDEEGGSHSAPTPASPVSVATGPVAPVPARQEPAQAVAPAAEREDTPLSSEPAAPMPAPVSNTKVSGAQNAPAVAAAPVVPVTPAPVTSPPATPIPSATAASGSPQRSAAPAVQPAPKLVETVFGITSTRRMAMAVFVRGDHLWMVTDQADLTLPPQIESGDPALFGEMETVNLNGGKAFRFLMPKGAKAKVEGSGLVWRVTAGPADQTPPVPARVQRMLADPAGPSVQVGLGGAARVLKLTDPDRGDDLAVIAVSRAGEGVTADQHFVDFDMLPTLAGGIVIPRADGISVAVSDDLVTIRKRQGLNIGFDEPPPGNNAQAAPLSPDEQKAANAPRFFAFKDWMLGKPSQYIASRQGIDERSATQDLDVRVQETVAGAKFMLAYGLAHEAAGYVEIALGLMPALKNSGEFQALQGAVYALTGRTTQAAEILSSPAIALMPEARIWKAVALAEGGKPADAYAALPRDLSAISDYPTHILELMTPALMDTVLEKKDTALASRIQEILDSRRKEMLPGARAMTDYYHGRTEILNGKGAEGIRTLTGVADTFGGPYPVRATMDLADYNYGGKTISRDDMIARLERFRFGWRGDELEAQVNEKLGLMYIAKGDERKGLGILRNAAALAKTPADRTRIDAVMKKAFRDLFLNNPKTLTPIDAASTANEFRELIPDGADGERIVSAIAEKLVEVDLLEQAATLLEQHMDKATSPLKAVQMGERAAAIRLLNKTPDKAIATIDRTKALAGQNSLTIPAGISARLDLLRARALADQGNTDAALAALAPMPDTADKMRLVVDTAWDGQKWDVVADAIGKLLATEKIDPKKPPTQEQAQMVLNRALAFNLAGDTAGMVDMQARYTEIMRRSPLFRSFQMVTRVAQEAALADRDTLMNMVSEVGLFQGFLEAYRQINAPAPAASAPATAAPAGAAAPATAPAAAPAQ